MYTEEQSRSSIVLSESRIYRKATDTRIFDFDY
jgi:hypothetical protein